MRRQVRGLNQAVINAQDGISAAQTAEGALNEVHDMLQRLEELSIKGENGTLMTVDRKAIADEVQQIVAEIDRIATTTTFNERNLLNGKFSSIGIQVGAESGQRIKLDIYSMSWAGLVGTTGQYSGAAKTLTSMSTTTNNDDWLNKSSGTGQIAYKLVGSLAAGATTGWRNNADQIKAFQSLTALVKTAGVSLSLQRSNIGAIQNRLEHTVNNLNNVVENTAAAEALIRDTDIASEMVKFSNNQILAQAGQSMLAQANQANSGALSLLQ